MIHVTEWWLTLSNHTHLSLLTFRLANFKSHCQYYIHTEIAFYFWVHPMVNIAMKQLIEKPKVHYTLHEHTRD